MAKGKKTGGGSRLGKPNKAVSEVKSLAREYGPAAIEKLAQLGGLIKGKAPAVSEPAQVSAIRDLLDRGYGKPTQNVELAPTEGLESLLDRIAKTVTGA